MNSFNKMMIQNKINFLKTRLSKYDYIGVKIATGCATIDEYADKIAEAEKLRKQIRELESELSK